MAGLCRFDDQVALCSSIAGSDATVPACGQRSAYTAIVRFEPVAGIGLTIDSEVCEAHNRKLSTASGYQRSIKLRQHAT